MKLKTLTKTIVDSRYRIKVFDGNDFIEGVTIDYHADDIYKNLQKEENYGRAKVIHIAYNKASQMIDITVDVAKLRDKN